GMSGSSRFIDCTAKGSDPIEEVPLGLAGKEALIIEETSRSANRSESQHSRFVSIPSYKGIGSRIYSERTVGLTNGSDFVVNETLKMSGPVGSVLRSWFRDTEPSARLRLFQNQLSMEADIDTFELGELDGTDRPLELRLS